MSDIDSNFRGLTEIAEYPEDGVRTVKPFTLIRAREICEQTRGEWEEFLTPSFSFEVSEVNKMWKIVARDSKGFRSSAFLVKRKTFEASMTIFCFMTICRDAGGKNENKMA